MLRSTFVWGLFLLTQTACSAEPRIVENATALRDLLITGKSPVSLETLPAQRGCGPGGCSIDLGPVAILREQGMLQYRLSKNSIQIQAQSSGDLPELDWEPIGGFSVSSSGKPWGICLEFTHTGLGKSGSFQRWSSVILVPFAEANSHNIAYRFVGYWAACDMLVEGQSSDMVSLPVVEWWKAGEKKQLVIHWHNCDASSCQVDQDARSVAEDVSSETGALIIESK